MTPIPRKVSRRASQKVSRRGLIAMGGLALVGATGMAGSSVVTPGQARSAVVAGRQRGGAPLDAGRIQWGEDPDRQWGRLFLPDPAHWSANRQRPAYPVVVFFHGGGWTDKSSPSYCETVARDLARYGVAVWLPTYRGTPDPGGWPMTFDDVSDGLDFVERLGEHADFTPDLDRVHVTGHSAGGHLAAWVAAREQLPPSMPGGGRPGGTGRIRVRSTTSLAGVLDLEKAVNEDRDHWVVDVLGGRPEEVPDRYQAMSPIDRLPLELPVNVLHGRADSVVPVATLRDYLEKHTTTGNPGRVVLMDGVEHQDFVNVRHRAWAAARQVCLTSVGPQPSART
ncbi:alpha/beta hydrolase [Kocuria coralli]|uniref:Alpha/beta hydrolase n=1 Tax=Kocuria coralli TaxID=1461025 RepID=A0A5J5KVU4_9MICC|nr:alpha/beta hydrolase [Kocuria coralli]KAA9392985.1 alpha/beta hydrolase [Kocuria coralli]